MKFRFVLFAALFVSIANTRAQRENAYDVLGKTLAPFVNLLAKQGRGPDRALSMNLRVIEATNLPRELANTTAAGGMFRSSRVTRIGCADGASGW